MARSNARADDCMTQAERTLTKFSPFGNKHEDAKELFAKAANYYKANQQWAEAGNAFLRVRDCAVKCKFPLEAANALVDAATAYRKVDVKRAVVCMQDALDIFDQGGRNGKSAKLAFDMAELFEKEEDVPNAITWYSKAADYYRQENSHTTANTCRLKVANFQALTERYDEAIDILETVARAYQDDGLLQGNCRTLYTVSLLCMMAKGVPADTLQAKFEEYCDRDVHFNPTTREHAFVQGLIGAIADTNIDKFNETVDAFEAISPLDNVKERLILRAKSFLRKPNLT
eukprot:TRINITY_DN46105_c0_g1_i1.p1 TRINITY_DN46105_c0_g1~~TRINITY_DN46105_c0_g1_i1.p1  ORF type:complete len:296 (-),score=67.10 TRINITY_DN46105_c0_g1_i1:20-880(-)